MLRTGDSLQVSSFCHHYYLSQAEHTRTTRSTAYGPAHSTFHNTARKIFTIRIFTRPLPSHRIFKLLHAYVKNWSSKVLFQVLLSTEMKVYIFFDASGTEKKKKRWLHFWLRDKQRGRECLGYSLLFWSRMLWTACPWLLYWSEYSILSIIHWEKKS